MRRFAMITEKQSRVRKDYWHAASRDIANRYRTAVIENFNILEIAKPVKAVNLLSGKDARAIIRQYREIRYADRQGFADMPDCECANLERIEPREATLGCAACGNAESKNREKQAVFFCRNCGHGYGAEMNAALNMHSRGLV